MIFTWTGPTRFHFLSESWMWGGGAPSGGGGGGSSAYLEAYRRYILMSY